jgi:hypothetical protein
MIGNGFEVTSATEDGSHLWIKSQRALRRPCQFARHAAASGFTCHYRPANAKDQQRVLVVGPMLRHSVTMTALPSALFSKSPTVCASQARPGMILAASRRAGAAAGSAPSQPIVRQQPRATRQSGKTTEP